MQVPLQVNGKSVKIDAAPHVLLVQALREHLKLTGTHVGCDTAQCGACTVLVDGRAVKSCNVLLAQVGGCEITPCRPPSRSAMAFSAASAPRAWS
jgi:carbon-monoxide dehydrogenase small subunit